MAASKRAADIGLAAIHIEGSLIAPAEVFRIAHQTPDEKMAVDYGSLKGTDLREKISGLFNVGRATWRGYDAINNPTVQQTAAFAKSMLEEVFGFEGLKGPVDHTTNDHRYRIAWEAKGGRVPVVVAAPDAEVDAFGKALPEFGDGSAGSRSKRSAAVLLQDWLNASDEALWGLAFAGDRIRLMRDNASFTRPAYIEADLGAIFRDEMYADFTALWLLIHASRFGLEGTSPTDCALERWRDAGEQAGTKVRDHLRGNVEQALKVLGQGFLDANPDLRAKLDSGDLSMQDWFNQILRTVYRLIFLAVAEDRNLLHLPETKADIRDLYASNYGFNHWRDRSARRLAYDHHTDNWETLNIVFSALETGAKPLGLPALGGLFKSDQTPDLNGAKLSNRAFLEAVFGLAWFVENNARARINWRDMATEELGSVYESLLELVPFRENGGQTFVFAGGVETKGNARKTSGSYYTPDSLVQCLLDSTLDPVLDKAEQKGGAEEILKLKVIDPACGSGHFLLGAARRMANRVAQVRNIDAPDYQAAMRDVVRNCIHGVDRNPMAIELAKVALWIETVTPGKPLGFLDANIVCGDSLLGVFDLKVLEDGIPDEAYKPLTGDDKAVASELKKRNKAEREGQGAFDWSSGGVAVMPPKKMAADVGHLRNLPEETVADVEAKRAKFEAWVVDPKRAATQLACDLHIASFLMCKTQAPDSLNKNVIPTTANVVNALSGGAQDREMVRAATETARNASVLHWPLAFPEVLIGAGGFDVVLGNPPWGQIQFDDVKWFSSIIPEISTNPDKADRDSLIMKLSVHNPSMYEEYISAKRSIDASQVFIQSSGRFKASSFGRLNTAPCFAELFLDISRNGHAGIIVPSGILTDDFNKKIFCRFVDEGRILSAFDFENRSGLFPGVDSRIKFSVITFGQNASDVKFGFFLSDPSEVNDNRKIFSLKSSDINLLSPNTGTAAVFRTKYDADLTANLYRRVPVLKAENSPISVNSWSVSTQLMFMINTDAKIIRDISTLDGGEIENYVPLGEGEYGHQYDHRFATFDGVKVINTPVSERSVAHEITFKQCVPKDIFYERIGRRGVSDRKAFVAFRRVARNTDERTMICAAMPFQPTSYGWIMVYEQGLQDECLLMANFNSLFFDYILRNRLVQPSIPQGVVYQCPVIPKYSYDKLCKKYILERVIELSYTSNSLAPLAEELGYDGPPFLWNEERRAQLRAELDAWYALAYGLTRDELRYVLDPKEVMGADYPSETFRVLQKNEIAKYGEYRTARLVLAAYDDLVRQGMRPRTEGYRQQ